MSRLVVLAALLAAGAIGCEASHVCATVGCLYGVTVSFTGLGAHPSYDITIASVTPPPDVVPISTCTLDVTDGGSRQLACTSSSETVDVSGTTVRIQDNTLDSLQITVSSGGAQVAQQTFDVTYQSSEINGPGCGVCTTASLVMTVP